MRPPRPTRPPRPPATLMCAAVAAAVLATVAATPARSAAAPESLPSASGVSPAATAGQPADPGTGTSVVPAPPSAGTTAASGETPAAPAAASNAPLDLNSQKLRRLTPGDAAAAAATAAQKPSAPASLDATRVGLALAGVIGLILMLRWGGRKFLALPAAGTSGLMQVVARTPLAPRQQLMLVRVGRRLMVIGDSGGRLSGLGQIEDPDEVAGLLGQVRSSASPAAGIGSASFGTLFGRLGQNLNRRHGDDSMELDATAEAGRRSEREQLLSDGGDEDDEADGRDARDPAGSPAAYGLAGGSRGASGMNSVPNVGLDEAQAQEAVEAARHDIQALRARLREVTERLTDPPAPDGRPDADDRRAHGSQ